MGDKIGHAEIKIGDSFVMLADEFPDMGHLGPKARGGTTVSLMIYVDDVDTRVQARRSTPARPRTRPVENQFWGDRMGTLTDPFGHKWTLATHVEDVPEASSASGWRSVRQAETGGAGLRSDNGAPGDRPGAFHDSGLDVQVCAPLPGSVRSTFEAVASPFST